MSDLWRDMDFALPAGHPSTFEAKCKQLRAENERLMGRVVKLLNAVNALNVTSTITHALEDGGINAAWGYVFEEILAAQIVSLEALKGGDT